VTIVAAGAADLSRYVEIAREAQARLRARNLTQWVPAAHDDYRSTVEQQLASTPQRLWMASRQPVGLIGAPPRSVP
jgi:hypothetical protein